MSDPREAVAAWMILHGHPTGHGDTLDDLLTELVSRHVVQSERLWARIRKLEYDNEAAAARIIQLETATARSPQETIDGR